MSLFSLILAFTMTFAVIGILVWTAKARSIPTVVGRVYLGLVVLLLLALLLGWLGRASFLWSALR